MDEKHPAMVAARNSWRCVQNKLKDEWLALMADDVVIEDPIGKSALDPEGRGHRGKEAAGKFWDRNIGPNSLQIEPHESFTCGSEAAHVLTLTTKLPAGLAVRVHGIFTYRVDDAGRIVSLRGFWDMTDLKQVS
jgi:steroid Delta-isomerase